ncbi:uncharacterized protein CANTADRAFT_92112 [Suhomyces tanzawaensis NRRL Y-17324]|uniref:FHA domain-containing protein n=1 Tax=Suhomyces tanzawaensis NRRL Y-17324 TaxID=984487 RepID=A0A1E4SBS8_9ASCO|nr:uncharacterized protein CANTADRAFT_92112 [Suhomyces tanzawaensis NRRL Y-17324]ODV76959.1 hypothetical protein CANTADRAFT_92112 [Suhomyces tanzawaensis NRRL Y-17324]
MIVVLGTIPNERIVALNEGEEVLIRRASTRDNSRAARITNLNFRNTHLSKSHAVLKYENASFFLKDEGSTFGTVVNNNFLLEGAWVKLVTGDTVGFIVTKPLAAIAEVTLRHADQATVPMSEFKPASLGLEFLIVISHNIIKFVPIEVLEVKEASDETLLEDFTKDVTEVSDEEIDGDKITAESLNGSLKQESSSEDTVVEEEALECLYNLGCCPGQAGVIQRYDPPTKSSDSLLTRLFEFFMERFSPKVDKESESRVEDKEYDANEDDVELILDEHSSDAVEPEEKSSGDVVEPEEEASGDVVEPEEEVSDDVVECRCTQTLEEDESNEEDELTARAVEICEFSEEEDSDLDLLLHGINARVSESEVGSESNESGSELDVESENLTGSGSDSESESESESSSLLDYNSISEVSSISSDASLISDILQLEAGSDNSESESSDGIEVTPVQVGKTVFLVANGEDLVDSLASEPDCWGRWNQQCKGRKRTFDETKEDDEDDDYEVDDAEVSPPPEKKAKKVSSTLKTFAKEVGKGLFYVIATITALGIYGGKLNDQNK